ncbi:hypothetical protein ETB97_011833 [Aspergillus alliaceus]|uniref:Uncharacterized protein n=1 Tax=Petromyces alliaceus TaxID=209559 RepID=A0A8H6A8V5_PETAA|nr:hypothetical protein ETB97_011833 [Aspergillus burnettii]
MRPSIVIAGILALAMYALMVIVVVWSVTKSAIKDSRRYGTRFLKCELLPLTKSVLFSYSLALLLVVVLTGLFIAPANDYITYEPRVIGQREAMTAPQYFGEPSEQIVHNWHEIMEHQNIGIPADLMHELGREDEGILLPDGTYFGSIMVFHLLHCLVRLPEILRQGQGRIN